MKIKTKLLLAFLIIALIPIGVISIVSYFTAKDALTHQVLSHLESVAEIQRNRVESIYEQNLERLNLVSSRTQLRLSLDSFISNPNSDDQDRMNQSLLDARSSMSSFRDISVLTLDGKVVASTDATKIGSIHLTDEAFIRGQNEDTADIFYLDENRNLCMYLSGPLYLEDKLLGVVVIESAGDSIIAAITDYTGLGTTGETQLAETDANGDALFITPTRFGQSTALSQVVPKDEVSSPIIQALAKNEALFTNAVDYRGKPVLAATEYIPETGWGLVTKIDRAEALASVSRLQYLLPMIVLLSLAFVLLISLLLSRAIARPIIKLAHMANEVSEGDLSVRAEVTSKDEIGILANACNQMKDSLVKTNSELEQELDERKKAEEKYTTLVERSNDGIIIIQDGLVKFANSKMIEMTGFSLKEATGKPFLEFVSPKYQASVTENYQRRVSGEKAPNNYEIEVLTKDGSLIPVEINASRIEYEKRPADMAIVRNITERKQAEVALRQSEERYRDLFDNANDLIQSVSPDGHFLYVNKAWQKVLGYSKKEIANLKIWDIIHPDSLDHCMETFQKVMSGDNVKDIEAVFVAKNGNVIDVEGNAHSRFIDGRSISTQGIFRDVTARKRAEERIVHLNSLLRALRDINQLITRESDRERLIKESRSILVRTRGYEKVWILLVDENKNPISIAGAGLGGESGAFMEQMRSGIYPECVKRLWNQKKPFLIYSNPGITHKGCILAGRHSRRAVYRCRLEYENKVYGMLGVTIPSPALSDEEEKDLFLELCGDISFALAAIEKEEHRRRMEEELRQSESRLAEAQRIAHIGSWELDLASNVLTWSDEVYRMFGLKPRQFGATYEPFLDNIHPDDREMVNRAYTESLKTKTPYNIVHRLLLKDGTVKYVNEKCETFYDDEGKPIRSIGTVQDITERRQSENALRASEEKLRRMFESITDGVTVADRDLNIVQLNEAVLRMHGYKSKEELVGRSALKLIVKRDHARAMENAKRTLKNGAMPNIEYTLLTKDGREFPAELSVAILKDGSENPIGFISISKDISERKKMEEQLILTDRLASVGELASGIAHELNNPLTGVIGLSQLLIQRDVPKDIKEDLSLVNSEAQRAVNVVKNLLTFARKHPPAKQPLNINEVIDKVLEIRAYEERVSNIEVVTHLAPDLPKIMGDYFQLQQVFLNIVINAEYFMLEAHGKGTLTITTQKRGGVVQASLADDGPGITKENLGHIFDPFFTTKEVGKGTGLGLSICHGIITAHGGRIYAESKPGKGATFIIELPLGQEEQ
ncbi:MAG TPA: PAS domain S-box protein [Dehalococcoidia bacterium]|nr:PAS domain S-box protein [Dehalococcoidia bacterium]